MSRNRQTSNNIRPARRSVRSKQMIGDEAMAPVTRKSSLAPRLRLLPITMMMAVLLMGLKLSDVYQSGIQIQRAYAAQSGGGDTAADNKPANDAAPTEQATTEAAAPEASSAPAETAAAQPAATTNATGPEVELAKLDDASKADISKPGEARKEFSQIELDILQSLSERREELERRASEMDLKEKLLEATELRINDKITEARGLKIEVDKLLEEYNKHEETKLKSLVKIYESMKPKDAATIFNELDMPILLEVIDQMSERKAAPILAQMDPLKAKELTVDLAEHRKLRSIPSKLGAVE